jgi:hypothetical protein
MFSLPVFCLTLWHGETEFPIHRVSYSFSGRGQPPSGSASEHPSRHGDNAALAHGEQQHDSGQHDLDPPKAVVRLVPPLGADRLVQGELRCDIILAHGAVPLPLQPLDDPKGPIEQREAAAPRSGLLAGLFHRAPDGAAVRLWTRISGIRDASCRPARASATAPAASSPPWTTWPG